MAKETKTKKAPKRKETTALAVGRNIRTTTRKLNLVADSIRGLRAERAVNELTFSKRRVAGSVKKVLLSAIANAENNHNLDVDRLVVSEAYVGKSIVMKRFLPRGRGRANRIEKTFSNITIIVREQEEKK